MPAKSDVGPYGTKSPFRNEIAAMYMHTNADDEFWIVREDDGKIIRAADATRRQWPVA
ncbi:MAG: hypothetical protein ACRDLU_02905 [Gaiellaceae bacterium]